MTRSVVARGLDLNDGGAWVTSEIGLWGLPASVFSQGQRHQMDGIWITNPYSGALSGALSGVYVGSDPADGQSALRALKTALSDGLFWLSVETPAGWQSIRVLRSGELSVSWAQDARTLRWSTQVTAPDPVWFRGGQGPDGNLDSTGQRLYTLGMHRISGGVKFPLVFPLRWATSTAEGEVDIYIPVSGRILIEIVGPVVSPTIHVTGDSGGYVLLWDGLSLGSSERLVVDPIKRSALLGGETPIIPSVRQWPEELGGGHWAIRYSGSEYNSQSKAYIFVQEVI